MVALVALIVWRLPIIVVILFFLVFGALDGVYLSSALTKVPNGAWFTLALAVIISSFFNLWRFGKEQQWKAEAEDRFPLSHMLTVDDDIVVDTHIASGLRFTPVFGGHRISTMQGMGIFFDKTGQSSTTPAVFIHFLEKFRAAPEVVVFFHLRPVHMPTIPPEERYTIARCSTSKAVSDGKGRRVMPNYIRLSIRHGYMDVVVTEDLGLLVFEQIRSYVIREDFGSVPEEPKGLGDVTIKGDGKATEPPVDGTTRQVVEAKRLSDTQLTLSARLRTLQSAWNSQVVYIVGKEQMRIHQWETNFVRRGLLAVFLWIRENTRSKVQSLNVEVEKLVEVGFVKKIK